MTTTVPRSDTEAVEYLERRLSEAIGDLALPPNPGGRREFESSPAGYHALLTSMRSEHARAMAEFRRTHGNTAGFFTTVYGELEAAAQRQDIPALADAVDALLQALRRQPDDFRRDVLYLACVKLSLANLLRKRPG